MFKVLNNVRSLLINKTSLIQKQSLILLAHFWTSDFHINFHPNSIFIHSHQKRSDQFVFRNFLKSSNNLFTVISCNPELIYQNHHLTFLKKIATERCRVAHSHILPLLFAKCKELKLPIYRSCHTFCWRLAHQGSKKIRRQWLRGMRFCSLSPRSTSLLVYQQQLSRKQVTT